MVQNMDSNNSTIGYYNVLVHNNIWKLNMCENKCQSVDYGSIDDIDAVNEIILVVKDASLVMW